MGRKIDCKSNRNLVQIPVLILTVLGRMKKAVFFDKDGVLNADLGPHENTFKPRICIDAAEIVAFCRDIGYSPIIITNQTVVARGLIDEKQLLRQFIEFELQFRYINPNARFERIYYCPHHPNATILEYRKICSCRKPKPGLLLRARDEEDIDLSNSFFIGDRYSDIIAGYLAGCKTILLESKESDSPLIETDLPIPEGIEPDFKIKQIKFFKEFI